ncbi:MAG: ribonuclease HII [Rikenellaceae bacterium]
MLENSYQHTLSEAGCDEAGRGCLAGSLFAAAVILPPDFYHPALNDSKKMSEKSRRMLRTIIESEAIAWAVQEISAERIDQINILNASFEGMSLAAEALSPSPEMLIIDGNRFKTHLSIPFECIVKGDGKYANIAAASVLAKTHRDEYMERIALTYPEYGWSQNKGYPTMQHKKAIAEYGITPLHRRSFNMGVDQLKLF